MATILYSTEDIGDAYAPSLNGALATLHSLFDIVPTVLYPVGGRRTLAQERALGGDASSDHVKGRAVDINNHQQFRNRNQTLFLSILAGAGWRNVTIGGQPFPKEPWHFANQTTTPAGGNTQPLPPATGKETDEPEMYYLRYTSALPNRWIRVDDLRKQYRIIPFGYEDTRLSAEAQAGRLPIITIADPIWGQTYGNEQFVAVP